MPNIDWIIHLVANGVVCEECGKTESSFHPNLCNAHTHGMEKYNHPDFQMVLRASNEEICRILNTLGLRVRQGERFYDGAYVAGIYEDCYRKVKNSRGSGSEVFINYMDALIAAILHDRESNPYQNDSERTKEE